MNERKIIKALSTKRLTHIRAYDFDKKKINDLSFELSNIQKAKVTTPEIIKRALNVPNLRDILIKDAEIKRAIRRGGRI